MAQPAIEYYGKMAELWDFFRGDTSGWPDRAFFLELIEREGGPVLDVGCGTGRLLLDYMQTGIDIDGVDNAPEMLDIARRKAAARGLAPRLYQQPMQGLDLPRRYQVVLVPSSSLQLLTDPADAAEAMARFAAHLFPGGLLAASVMKIHDGSSPLDTGWELSAERARDDGVVLRRWSRSVYDPVSECEETEDRYEVVVDGEVVEREAHKRAPATRNYTQHQSRALFEAAGLANVTLYGDFTWRPALPEDRVWVAAGRKQP